ncbi:MAG: hypothetical protein ABIJ18_04735 [archaeon]
MINDDISNKISFLEQERKLIVIVQKQIQLLISQVQELPRLEDKLSGIIVIEKVLLMFIRDKIFSLHPVFDMSRMRTALTMVSTAKKQIFQPNFEVYNKKIFVQLKFLEVNLNRKLKKNESDISALKNRLNIRVA